MPDLAARRVVAYHAGERRRHEHVPAHHHAPRENDAEHTAHKVHPDKSREHHARCGQHKAQLAHAVDDLAEHHTHHRRGYQHHAQHDGVPVDPEIVLDINNKVGEEHLHRDGEHAKRRKREIQRGIIAHHVRPQTVDEVFQIRLTPGLELRLFYEEYARDARDRYERAEDREEPLPLAALGHAVKRAEDHQHG